MPPTVLICILAELLAHRVLVIELAALVLMELAARRSRKPTDPGSELDRIASAALDEDAVKDFVDSFKPTLGDGIYLGEPEGPDVKALRKEADVSLGTLLWDLETKLRAAAKEGPKPAGEPHVER